MTSSDVVSTRSFVPATVVPAQRPSSGAIQPEKRLLLAMLEDALTTAVRAEPIGGGRRRSPSADARAWIFSDDSRPPFSFVNVCGFLGFDPDYLRRSVYPCAAPRRIRSGARRLSGSRTRVVRHGTAAAGE